MKKLIALILITTLLLCGCSLFGQAEDGGSLSDKLSGLERGDEQETAAADAPTPGPTLEPLPDSLSFAQLDPWDLLHNGWALTEEQAAQQYGLELDSSGVDAGGEVASGIPGTTGCTAGGRLDFGSLVSRDGDFDSFTYEYRLDERMPPEDAIRLFRMAVAAADAQAGGRNQRWSRDIVDAGIDFYGASDQELIDFAFDGGLIYCTWGVETGEYLGDRPCLVELSLYGMSDYFFQMGVQLTFDVTLIDSYVNNDRAYFPDDYPAGDAAPSEEEAAASAASGPSAAGDKPQALYTEPPGSPTAVDMVRLGTYENDDVFGVGLVWRVTFYNDYTFEFSYDHEEGTEHFTGNWHTVDNGGELRVVLNITGAYPFTVSLDVDGGKYIAFDDGEFWPDFVSLPYVG